MVICLLSESILVRTFVPTVVCLVAVANSIVLLGHPFRVLGYLVEIFQCQCLTGYIWLKGNFKSLTPDWIPCII